LEAGEVVEQSKQATATVPILEQGLADRESAEERVEKELALAATVGGRLVTVLDEGYPANLKLVPNLPPFLFLLGDDLRPEDLRSVAVVGTREASERGLRQAARMARLLSENGVTVVSGLAKGVDTAAHTATLDTCGRTVAVIGTGVTRTYPSENTALADRIVKSGVIVSQFWPSTRPAQWTFPRRNVVTSGIAQGTVVIEASSTSGAKMQARLALEHGKRVFLLRSLVSEQPWAKKYVDTRGAIEIAEVEDVVRLLAEPHRIVHATEQRQLTLDVV
jgi:DNA processing protein